MYVNFTPNKGFKLLGSETGAFLADSINNDTREIKNNTISDWIPLTSGTIGGTATIEKYRIILLQGTNSIWMGARTSVSTVIGEFYSVTCEIIDYRTFGPARLGASSTAQTIPSPGAMDLAVESIALGVSSIDFQATSTTTYIYLINGDGALGSATFKNEIELRLSTVVGSAEGIELNQLNNATSDQTGEADSTNGFTSFGLDGTGLNVFKTVSNLPYPELHTNQNAASPDGVTEADNTIGFTSSNLDGTGNNLFQSEFLQHVNIIINGTFDIDSDWTKGAGWSIGSGVATHATGTAGPLEQAIALIGGQTYEIEYTLSGITGGNIYPYFYSPSVIGTVRSANGTYNELLVASTGDTLIRFQASSTFDGSIDNISIRETGERNLNFNAVAPTLTNESDSTSGFTSAGLDGTGANSFRSAWIDRPNIVGNGTFDGDYTWVDDPNGTIGGTIVITGGELVVTQGSNSVWMGSTQAVTTVIGKIYVFEAERTLDSGVSSWQLRVSNSQPYNSVNLAAKVFTKDGFNHVKFKATATTTYVKIYNGGGPSIIHKYDNAKCFLLDEKNENANAVSPLLFVEADNTTGFTSVGLDGTGLNIFKSVRNIAYPERVINGGFDTDTNWTKGTGWTIAAGVATSDGTGVNSQLAQSITWPSIGSRVVISFEITAYTSGIVYIVINGVGGTQGGPYSTAGIYAISYIVTGVETELTAHTAGSGFTGSIDNYTLKESNEYHTIANAAADPAGLEANTITGIGVAGSATVTSVASPVDTGSYAISAESNTTPTNNARAYWDLNSAGLINGREYTITFAARHNGTGGDWRASLGEFNTGSVTTITDLDNTETTYADYSITFTKGTPSNFLTFMENSGTDDGGVYIDNLSITEVQVNHGTYAIQAEANDTPATQARIYTDLNAAPYNLVYGKRYTVTFDAKHVGVGQQWLIGVGSTTVSTETVIATLTNSDNSYSTYSAGIVHNANTRFFSALESLSPNDGGIFLDNLSIRESNEHHIYRNAANIYDEADKTDGCNVVNNALVTSTTVPWQTGDYCLEIESNTTPTANANGYFDMTEATYGMTVGRQYKFTLIARHVGSGGDWGVRITGSSTNTLIVTLTNTDITFTEYNYTFVHNTADHRYIQFVELSGTNDGGVYVDALSITEVQVNHGNNAIHVEANDTPSVSARISTDLNAAPYNLVEGKRYVITLDAKHVGVGGIWLLGMFPFSSGGGGVGVVNLSNTANAYQSYSKAWRHTSISQWFVAIENSATNDGGCFLDNLSIRESNEYHIWRNAANIYDENNTTTGWTFGNNAVLSSVTSPVDNGSYAISGESNTTPTAFSWVALQLDSTTIDLIDGREYTITFRARHNGTGDEWRLFLNSTVISAFTWSTSGGVYIDSLSIVETQVNHGNFSIHADANDTPTASARFYSDIQTDFSLIQGTRYVVSLDAKHIGVGLNWRIELYASSFGSGSAVLIKELAASDNSYNSYALSIIYDSALHKHLVVRESNTSNNGGVFFDNLSIKESNEYAWILMH
jgi:hypothetical protein